MKKITTIVGLLLLSTTVFAGPRQKASKPERAFLCQAVKAALEEGSVEATLAKGACSSLAQISSTLVSEGARQVTGKLRFNSPGRKGYYLTCSATYFGQATMENIIGDLEDISCQ